MKLVEILARVWPNWIAPYGKEVQQNLGGRLFSDHESGTWFFDFSVIAEDQVTAKVTRAQWEAERARIAAMEGISAVSQEQANAEAEREKRVQYEQEVWDMVAAACYAQRLSEGRGRLAVTAFHDADVFMEERAKRLKVAK